MHNILPVLIGTIFLTSCASNGDLILESGSEEYEGRPAAAVAPVVNPGPGRTPHDDRLHADIQRSIQRQLDQSGIFAGVVALERPNDGNEAEVIIEPTLVGPGSHGSGDVDLRVRVSEKTNRRTVLDRTYESSDGRANTLNVAVSELEDDLADRYGR